MVEIIAEFCQNHNGDFELLKDMVYAAKEYGATHGKIQTIFSDDLTFRDRFEEGIVENGIVKAIKRPYEPEFARLKKLDLSYDQQAEFINICEKVGLKPLTTAFTMESIQKLKNIGFKDIKVASYDCCSLPFLKELKKYFSRLIVSTGATFDSEIEEASEILHDHNFSFLHCVTIYPTPLNKMNLNRMKYLKEFTPSVGLSEHSLVKDDGINASKVAISQGAEIIERHFTILPADQTKDGAVSITPTLLEELVQFSQLDKESMQKNIKEDIPEYKLMLGNMQRELTDEELLNRDYYKGRFSSKETMVNSGTTGKNKKI